MFTDIEAVGLAFTDSVVSFDLDVDNIITFSVDIMNNGGTAIASITTDSSSTNNDDNNWSISFYVSDTSDPTDSASTVIDSAADTTEATNMAAGIAAGATITLESVYGMINVPSSDCTNYQYLCVVISKGSTAVYTDSDSTNNYYCLPAFGNVDATELQCSGKRQHIKFKTSLSVFRHTNKFKKHYHCHTVVYLHEVRK